MRYMKPKPHHSRIQHIPQRQHPTEIGATPIETTIINLPQATLYFVPLCQLGLFRLHATTQRYQRQHDLALVLFLASYPREAARDAFTSVAIGRTPTVHDAR